MSNSIKETENNIGFVVGEEVLSKNNYGKCIDTIIKITPKGSIRTKLGGYFDCNGVSKSSDYWHSSHIYKLTDEMRTSLNEEKIIHEVLQMMKNTKNISYEKALKIKELLND